MKTSTPPQNGSHRAVLASRGHRPHHPRSATRAHPLCLALLILLTGCHDGPSSTGDGAHLPVDAGHADTHLDRSSPFADADLTDRGTRDMHTLDHGDHDAGPPSDADPPPADATVEPDLYPFEPDPICAELTPIDLDPLGDYTLVPAPLGDLDHVDDIDGDGRSELFVLIQNLIDVAPLEEQDRVNYVTIYAWDEGDNFVDRGTMVGVRALAVMDLPPAHGTVVVGLERFVDLEWESVESTIGVRADSPGAEWRFDTSVHLFAHRVPDPWGELTADYFAPFDVDVFDGDADGHPEILTFSGDLIEWQGDHFEVIWRVVDADPRDEIRQVGGGLVGRVAHGDFDDDGRMDFVLAGNGGLGPIGTGNSEAVLKHVRVFENQGDNDYRLVTRLPYGANNAQFAASGDIDGDGRPEFLYGGAPGSCIRFEIWSGVADDTYVRLARIDHVASRGIPTNKGITAFGDLDGDGDDELVANISQSIVAWDWDGMQLRQILSYPYCENCNWNPIWTGDLEGDGIDEIFFSKITGDEIRRNIVLSPTGVRILRLNPAP